MRKSKATIAGAKAAEFLIEKIIGPLANACSFDLAYQCREDNSSAINEWVAIEEAPKDGSSFIAWDVLNNEPTLAYWLKGNDECFNGWFHVGDFTGGARLSHMLKVSPPSAS